MSTSCRQGVSMTNVFLEYDNAKDNYKIVVFVGSEQVVLDSDDVEGYSLYTKGVGSRLLGTTGTPLEYVGSSYTAEDLQERYIFTEY